MTNPAVASLCSPSHLRDYDGFYPASDAVTQEAGPASITMGVVFDVADARTFATFKSVATLAEESKLPATTVKKHLAKLCSAGWLDNHGRQSPGGRKRPRRTVTYQLTRKAQDAKVPYAAWPKWLACWPPWLTREQTLVYAQLLSRACLVENIEAEGCGSGEERLYMSNLELHRRTGLSRNTIRRAIKALTDPRQPLLEEADARIGQEGGGYNAVLPHTAPEWIR